VRLLNLTKQKDSDVLSKERMKKRVFSSGNAEGQKSISEVQFKVVHGRHETNWIAASEGKRRYGGVEEHERKDQI